VTATLLVTPLETVLRAHGAVMGVRHGRLVAAHFGSVASETAVCLRSVGLADGFGRAGAPADRIALVLLGPRAPRVLQAARLGAAPFPASARADPDGYEVLVPREDGAAAWRHLLRAGEALGITCVGFDAVEHLAVAGRR
jgi:hypothetical protein